MFRLRSSSTAPEAVPMIVIVPKPSRPDRPSAIRDGDNCVTLNWTKPEDDNGAAITGYVIMYGDRNTDVKQYNKLPVDGNTTKVQFSDTDQLNNRTSCRFAVAAVNADGQGEFSEFTDYVGTSNGE